MEMYSTNIHFKTGLFPGILNWGGIDKCLGGVNMR